MNKIKFPCFDNLKMVDIKKLKANDYNPNKMDRTNLFFLFILNLTFYNQKSHMKYDTRKCHPQPA